MKDLINKYKEVISYLFFGVCTTVINFIAFYFFEKFITHEIANIFAWAISVTFAFITNKLFVFKTKGFSMKEVSGFLGARVLSLVIDEGLLILAVNVLLMNAMISKIVINFLVIAINYILSKFLIFKKKGDWFFYEPFRKIKIRIRRNNRQ